MEYENTEIGTEQPQVEPKPVVVTGCGEEDVNFPDKKETAKKLVLKVEHPDVKDMELSKVKFEKNKKLKDTGLWLSKDKDGNLPYNSAVATLLRFYSCKKITDLVGKTIQTTQDEGGFLVAKAY